jgi:tetratricopeptide (TPR) repeat protein
MMVAWRVDGSLDAWAPALRQAAESIPIAATRAATALFLCDLGQLEDARVVYEGLAENDFGGIPQDPARLHTIAFLSEVCAVLNDASRAKTLYELLLPYASRNLVTGPPALSYLGPVARHLGSLAETMGGKGEAIQHFEAALRMTSATGARPFTVLTQRDYASALLNGGQRERAIALLDEARVTAEELGMKAVVQQLDSLRTRAAQPVPFKAGGTPFIGRDEELERLRGLYAEAAAGRGKLMVISGEPGIGKTRLAIEIAAIASAEGANVMYGRCDEDTLVPYQPFVEALKQLVDAVPSADLAETLGIAGGEISRLIPDIRRRLPGLAEPIQGDPEGERYRLFEATAVLLRTAAARRPTVLVIDDMHWADKPTVLLLKHVLRALSASAFWIIGTFRESEVSRDHPLAAMLADLRNEQSFDRIPLDGFGQAEVTEMIQAVAGSIPPPTFARALHSETEGNPFFLTEILLHLRETGTLEAFQADRPGEAALDEMEIPESIRDVIVRRLSRLSDDANTLLSVGSLVGREFPLDVVSHVAEMGEDQLLRAAEEAVVAGVIDEDAARPDRFMFSHALIRETLLQELSSSRRVRLHHRIAVAIEELHANELEPHLAALSLHLLNAGQQGDLQKAIVYSRRAGERAAGQLAYEDAANCYRRALDALALTQVADESLRGRLLLLLGESQRKSGDPGAKTTLKEATDAARMGAAASVLADAALLYAGPIQASTAVLRADQSLEISLLEEAAALLSPEDPLLVRVLARLAVALFWVFRRDDSLVLSERALGLARRGTDPAALSAALSAHRYATWAPGNALERLEGAREIQRLARKAGDREQELEAISWMLMDLIELGDGPAANESLDAYVGLAQELKQPRYVGMGRQFLALREITEGRFESGGALAQEAMEIGQQIQNPDAMSWFAAQMVVIWRATGALKQFESAIRDAVEIAPVPAARAGLTLILVDLGLRDEARVQLDAMAAHDFTDLPRDLIFLQTTATLAEVAWSLGDRPRAERLYDILSPFAAFNALSGPPPLNVWGPIPLFLGMLLSTLGRHEEAEHQFTVAIRMCDALNANPLKANTQHVYASMLADVGEIDSAVELTNESLAAAQRIGMSVLVTRLENLKARLRSDLVG